MLSHHRRRTPRAKNLVRGDLFVGGPRPATLLFVFQRRGWRAIRQAGLTRAAEKQKEGGGSCVSAINRPPRSSPRRVRELVGESPTRRIKRFTTERPGACPCRKAGGESSPGIEPTGRNEDEPHRMSPVMLKARRRRASGVLCEGRCSQETQSPCPANSVGVSVVGTPGRCASDKRGGPGR